MEITNYDSVKQSNDCFKRLYEFMPKNTFRMLLAGNSGSGKTNLLSHILQCPLIYYDQIHLYAKNLDQDKYINLIDKMNGISEHVGYPVLIASNDEIIPVNQLDNDMQRVVIFDDFPSIAWFRLVTLSHFHEHLLTTHEVFKGKSQTETLPY